jgi:hypothetical protein
MEPYCLTDLQHDMIVLMLHEITYTGIYLSLPGMFTGFYDRNWRGWSSTYKEFRYDLALFYWLKCYPKVRRVRQFLSARGNQLTRCASHWL